MAAVLFSVVSLCLPFVVVLSLRPALPRPRSQASPRPLRVCRREQSHRRRQRHYFPPNPALCRFSASTTEREAERDHGKQNRRHFGSRKGASCAPKEEPAVKRQGGGKFLDRRKEREVDPAGKFQGGKILGGGKFLDGYGTRIGTPVSQHTAIRLGS